MINGLVEGLLLVLIGLGFIMATVGYMVYWQDNQFSTTALVAFALIFGLGNSVTGIVGLTTGATPTELGFLLWAEVAAVVWAMASIPWIIFVLQYTGRYSRITRRFVTTLCAPLAVVILNIIHSIAVVWGWDIANLNGWGIANSIASFVFLYCVALYFLGAFWLVQSTYSYVHLSFKYGVALAAAPLLVVQMNNTMGQLLVTSIELAAGGYTLAFAVATLLFGVTLSSDSFLERTPAVKMKGREAITRETDDLVCIVDERDTLVEHNMAVSATLQTDASMGEPIVETLDYDTADLESRETISLETSTGKRRYDPQVSLITVNQDTEIGAVLSLRDVTERELREQRLAVFNRVLRHNIQNKIDIINGHAEVLDDRYDDDHVASITAAADSITDLGSRARLVDRFVSSTSETEQVDLVEHFEAILRDIGPDAMISITTDLPRNASVRTNREALTGAFDSALDNALTYARSTVEVCVKENDNGYTVFVDDDGPGIPDRELELLDAGTETELQHGTGLGLWQLRWAVTTMGGDLSFETGNGTTVRFTVPDQG